MPTLTFADKAPIWLFAAIPGGLRHLMTNIERIQAKARELALRQVPWMASNCL